jgi:hypothetical protein
LDVQALSQKAAATLLNTTPRSLRDWEAAGEGVPRNVDGTYPGAQLVAWYVDRCSGEKLDANRERARKDAEAADKLALENAVTRSELGRLSEMEEWFGGHVERARARLIQIPDAVGQFCDPRNAAIVVTEVRRLIYEACAELASDGASVGAQDHSAVDAATNPNGEPVGGPVPKAVERKQRRARTVAN